MRPHREILIATGNPAKFREMVAVLTEPSVSGPGISSRVQWRMPGDLSFTIDEPVEDGASFAANAAIKAMHYARASGIWAIADDSGLEVDGLDGVPGVHSARFAGLPPRTPRLVADAANNEKLIRLLRDVPAEHRTARFRCALAVADGERILATAEGVIEGVIIDEPLGSGGFGYDPHFFIPQLGLTTAELAPEHKNRISHRGKALRALRARLDAINNLGGM